MLTNYVLSGIRTVTPLVIGGLLTWLASSLHIVVDPNSTAALVALCVAVLSAGYYALARLLEARFRWASILLGTLPVQPTYAKVLPGGNFVPVGLGSAATVLEADSTRP